MRLQIETSVIGRECEIGRNCVVRDSYIGDGVTVHEGAMVVGALVLPGAVIHAGAKLLPGCIVSYKVPLSILLTSRSVHVLQPELLGSCRTADVRWGGIFLPSKTHNAVRRRTGRRSHLGPPGHDVCSDSASFACTQCVIGKGHTVLERERISLCQQQEQIASFSDDELEMPSNTGAVKANCPPEHNDQ